MQVLMICCALQWDVRSCYIQKDHMCLHIPSKEIELELYTPRFILFMRQSPAREVSTLVNVEILTISLQEVVSQWR